MARKHFLAHLSHVELITPKLEQSVAFFRDVVGLDEVGREGQSVSMRCWGDHYHHSLILTAGEQPALGHGSWRTHGPEELEAAVASIEATGTKGEWVERSRGHGRAYRFKGPSGHPLEIFWEVERYVAPPELRSPYPDRPQRRGTRGIAPRQLDHLTVATRNVMSDAAWYRDTLGFRFMAYTSLDHNPDMVVFGVVTTNETSHGGNIMYRNSPMPDSMLESFPPAPGVTVAEPEAVATVEAAAGRIGNPWGQKK
jgi:catechol 2,3-dioxygenase